MKKKILIALTLLFSFIPFVNAEEQWLTYDWGVLQGATYPSDAENWSHTTEVNDGYVTATLDESGMGILRKYSRSGELIWTHNNEYGYYFGNSIYYGGYIYVPYYDSYYGTFVAKYDSTTGKWVEEVKVNELTDDNYDTKYVYGGELYRTDDKLYLIYKGPIKNSNIQTDYSYGPVCLYTIDIETMELENAEDYWNVSTDDKDEISGNNTELLDENLNSLYTEDGYETIISQQIIGGNYKYAIGYIYNETSKYAYGLVVKIDSNNNIVWTKKSSSIGYYYDAAYISADHIAVTTFSRSNGSKILVFDENGEIVETHDVSEEIGLNEAEARGNIITLREYSDAIVGQVVTTDGNSFIIRYIPKYEIAAKVVSGNGTIDVIKTAGAGEEVTFVITPEKGYVLGEVKVTDAYGNVLTFTSNTFTMPNADVTIEVTFIAETVENPKTSDIAIIITLSLLLIGTIAVTYTHKKLKWLK